MADRNISRVNRPEGGVLGIREVGQPLHSCLLLGISGLGRNAGHNGLCYRFPFTYSCPARLLHGRDDAEIQIALVAAGAGVACRLAFHHIINGFVPVLPALSAGVNAHDLVLMNPFAEQVPGLYPLRRVNGYFRSILAKNAAALAHHSINHVAGAPHRLPAEEACFAAVLDGHFLSGCGEVFPSLQLAGVNPAFLKSILTVIHNLGRSVHRKEILLAVNLALLQEGLDKILFIKIRLLGNQLIHRSKIPLARPVHIGGEHGCRNLAGSNGRLKLLFGFAVVRLHDAFDDDLLLRGVEFLNERFHIFA
ncbi:hypothetical protein D3C73_747550 [compost metagenome]